MPGTVTEAGLSGIAVPRAADVEALAGSVMMIDSTTLERPSGPPIVCVIRVAMFEGDSVTAELTPVPLTSDVTLLALEVELFPAGATVRVIVRVDKTVREIVEYSSDEISDVR